MTVFKYKNGKLVKVAGNSGGGSGSTTPPDTELSETSTNSVQNKVITAAFNNKANKFDVIEVMAPHGRTNDYIKEVQWYGTTMTFKYGFFDVSLSDASNNAVQNKVITKELLGTLLWENGGQTMGEDTLRAIDMFEPITNFKYIVIEYAQWDGETLYQKKIPVKDGPYRLYCVGEPSIAGLSTRKFTISGSSIVFEQAISGSTSVTSALIQYACVPLKIYGTNVL